METLRTVLVLHTPRKPLARALSRAGLTAEMHSDVSRTPAGGVGRSQEWLAGVGRSRLCGEARDCCKCRVERLTRVAQERGAQRARGHGHKGGGSVQGDESLLRRICNM